MKGRPRDPKRARRRTGNRPQAGELKLAPTDPFGVPVEAWPPEPPEDLPEDAAVIWQRLAPDLPASAGAGDLEALRMLCVSALRARRATMLVEKHGELVRGDRGPMVNPMTKLERDAHATYIRLAEQLGLTFAAKTRLGVVRLQGASLMSALEERLGRRG